MMKSPQDNRPPLKQPTEPLPQNKVQLIWGIALVLMGLAVIYRMPVVIDKLSDAGSPSSGFYFSRFCFYLMAVILMGGGVKKIDNYRRSVNMKNNSAKNDGLVKSRIQTAKKKASNSRRANPEQ